VLGRATERAQGCRQPEGRNAEWCCLDVQVSANVELMVMAACMGSPSVVTPKPAPAPTGSGGRGGGGGTSREQLLSLGVAEHRITKDLMSTLNGRKKQTDQGKAKVDQRQGKGDTPKVQKMLGGNPDSRYPCFRKGCGPGTMCHMSHANKAVAV